MSKSFIRSSKNKLQFINSPIALIIAAFILLGLIAFVPFLSTRAAGPILTIQSVSWDVIGLDSTNVNAGPNLYQIGARVCNTGDAPATNVQTVLAWDSSNPYINLVSTNTLSISALAQGDCSDFYYPIAVSRDTNVFTNRTRLYHVDATGQGVSKVTYNGELYVTELVPELSPATGTLTGPTSLVAGNTYQFSLVGTTVYTDSQQLEHFVDFPNDMFQIESISSVFSRFTIPPGNSNDKIYFDACGWNKVTRTCNGIGYVGGNLTTIYNVKVLKPGTAQLNTTLYGFSNNIAGANKYFYQTLVSSPLSVSAINPTETPTLPATSTATATATITPTLTATATITPTATVAPNINLVKDVDPTQARVGQLFNFRISVANVSVVQLTNAIVTDQFPIVLTITGVQPSKGTASIDAVNRIVTLNIGNIAPNETVTLSILAQVNSQAIVNANYTNSATLSYKVNTASFSKTSNSISYRVIGSSTLPPTGGMLEEGTGTSPIYWITMLLAVVFGTAGIGLLIASFWAKSNLQEWQNWFRTAGVILIAGCIFFVMVTWAINLPAQSLEQAAEPTPQEVTPSTEALVVGQYWELLPTPTPDKLPDYAIPTPTAAGDNQDNTADTSPVERIQIPSLALDTVVKFVPFDGFTWMISGLKQEIAWMGGTSWPGLGKNTGLAGHVTLADGSDGPFNNLTDLNAGDLVTLYTQKNIYTYKVRSQAVVEDADFSVLGPTDQSQITLITCTNWNKDIRAYLDRLVVYADLEMVEPILAASGN